MLSIKFLAVVFLPACVHGCVCSVSDNSKACIGPCANSPLPWCKDNCPNDGDVKSWEYSNPCFSKDSTTACKLHDAAAAPAAAFDACYNEAKTGAAARVLMASLAVGDVVLTTTTEGALAKTTVLANHHASHELAAKMLTLTTADGATLSVTPEHALFVDGALAAAADAAVGSTLTRADGAAVKVTRVTEADAAAVINPVTASGTILASDGGAPLLAAAHLMLFAPLYKYAASRAVVNVAVYVVGDETNWTTFVAILLGKAAAALALGVAGAKMLQRGAK